MTPLSGRQPVADLIRAATLIAALPTFIFGATGDALRFLLVGVLLFVLRLVEAPRAAHAAFAAAALLATLANVFEWYKYVSWIDTVIHALTTATAAALASAALIALAGAADPAGLRWWHRFLFTAGLGALGAVLWEFYEWTYEQFAPNSMVVGYADTLADLAAGLGGSAVAAAVLVAVSRRR